MESEAAKTSKRKSQSYNRRILLRGKRGTERPLSIIIDYLDDLPVKCDIEQLVKEFLIHRYLPLALKNKRNAEAESKLFAYESIRFFQGIIDAIKEAFDMQDEPSTPVVSLVIQGADVHVQEDNSLEGDAVLGKDSLAANGHNKEYERYSSNGHFNNGHSNGVNQAQNLLGL